MAVAGGLLESSPQFNRNVNVPKPDDYLVQAYPGGVVAIDSGFGRRNMAACYLLERRRRGGDY